MELVGEQRPLPRMWSRTANSCGSSPRTRPWRSHHRTPKATAKSAAAAATWTRICAGGVPPGDPRSSRRVRRQGQRVPCRLARLFPAASTCSRPVAHGSFPAMAATILILPGYGDSGPGHWQTLWERGTAGRASSRTTGRIPISTAWTRRLDEALDRTDGPVGSSRTAWVARWWRMRPRRSDRGSRARSSWRRPTSTRSAICCPRSKRSRPCRCDNCRSRRSSSAARTTRTPSPRACESFANAWGARHVELDGAGHVNVDSGHGEWPEGQRLLAELLEAIRR